jgi:3-oxoacyl-[acyl-carrier-protein] synthase-3
MKIVGTGSCLPQRVVSNDDLAAIMDTSDEWISSRTGIRNRHIATTETTTSLACDAVKSALQDAGIDGSEIDLIIAASVSTDKIVPSLACQIQAEIGAEGAVAFDINAACSGFLFGLATADAYFKTGRFHKAVVVGAEVLSKIMDWNDRSTCVLFGDGAGAAVVTDEGDAIKGFVQGSDGKGGEALDGDNRTVVNPFTDNGKQSALGGYVTMDGPAVYKFAVKTVPKAINELLDEIGWSADDVDVYVLHQANIRIIESVAKRLKQPMDKFPTNLQQCGNISAASVPILLDKVRKDGMIKHEEKIILSGFGAGLTWGACAIEWQ